MRRQSRKRAALVRIYLKRRGEFLGNQPWCLRCGALATEVHHKAGRVGGLLLDESKWAAVCAGCHRYITEHPAEAVDRGWSLLRVSA